MNEQDLSVTIGGVIFESPIMNAAGECKAWPHVRELANSSTAAVILGSITVAQRDGNPGETYRSFPTYSINARGLPNLGLNYYAEHLNTMVALCHEQGKPFIVSIAGTTINEFPSLMNVVYKSKADLIEVNLGCPNVIVAGEHKPVFAYDPEMVELVLDLVSDGFDLRRTLLKVSPYLTFTLMEDVAEVISDFPTLAGVTSCNTLPNGYYIMQNGRPVIDPVYGGVAGPALLPISLGQVKKLRELLPESIAIIGVGGISNGEHMLAYLRAGATAVQVGTAFFDQGKDIFGRILIEYTDLLEGESDERNNHPKTG